MYQQPQPVHRPWSPQPVVYAPPPMPGAKYGMSRSLASRARWAGAFSALFGQLGMLLLLTGVAMVGSFGLNWVISLTDEAVDIEPVLESAAGWGIALIAVGVILLIVGTIAGQLFAAACGIHKAGATAWWGSVLFNIAQVMAYGSGLVFVLPFLAPLIVFAFGLPQDTAFIAYLIGMVVCAVINSLIGMWISGLLWQWMAWAHRPYYGERI